MSAATAQGKSPVKPTILFVDDEPRVLKSMRAMFRREYNICIADSGAEALKILAQTSIDVVVSDQRMPHMTGVEVLCAIKQRSPATIRILLTGYADLEAIEASLNEAEVFRYLMKPCPAEEIRAAVLDGLALKKQPPRAEVIPINGAATSIEPPRKRATPSQKQLCKDLLLFGNSELKGALKDASGGAKVVVVGRLDDLSQAIKNTNSGVLVVDVPIAELESTVAQITRQHPQLVVLTTSDRSDANLLIDLINQGLVFRFLVKPVQPARFKITLAAATQRATEVSRCEDSVPDQPVSRWTQFVDWVFGQRGNR